MRFQISYTTEYRYSTAVSDQHNALRLRPASAETQELEAFELRVAPATRVYARRDYFGTDVLEFSVAEPHETLSIGAEARVSTARPASEPDPTWEELAQGIPWQATEMCINGPSFSASERRIREMGREVRRETPLATLRHVIDWLPERFEYRAGVTYVGSTIADLLEGGAGVCQDFVHLALELMRVNGVPARYVSGYLFAPNGEDEASAEVMTHAWLEALLPEPDGTPRWIGADPTNRTAAADAHVKIGHGRHYSDVPPIRGVYRGAATAEHEARVEMRRLGT